MEGCLDEEFITTHTWATNTAQLCVCVQIRCVCLQACMSTGFVHRCVRVTTPPRNTTLCACAWVPRSAASSPYVHIYFYIVLFSSKFRASCPRLRSYRLGLISVFASSQQATRSTDIVKNRRASSSMWRAFCASTHCARAHVFSYTYTTGRPICVCVYVY